MSRISQKNKWQLWGKRYYASAARRGKILFQTDYAFVDPDGIISEHRAINPLGYAPVKHIYHSEKFCFWDLRGERMEILKDYEGWKKVKTKMNDEQLSKGWLLF